MDVLIAIRNRRHEIMDRVG